MICWFSGVHIKTCAKNGGGLRGLVARNITMHAVRRPLFISMFYCRDPKRQPDSSLIPFIEDVHLQHFKISGRSRLGLSTLSIQCSAQRPCKRIALHDFTFLSKTVCRYVMPWMLTTFSLCVYGCRVLCNECVYVCVPFGVCLLLCSLFIGCCACVLCGVCECAWVYVWVCVLVRG